MTTGLPAQKPDREYSNEEIEFEFMKGRALNRLFVEMHKPKKPETLPEDLEPISFSSVRDQNENDLLITLGISLFIIIVAIGSVILVNTICVG